MLETSKPKLEEATEEEIKQGEHTVFPIGGIIFIGVLILLIIACIIVIAVLE